MVGNKFQGLIYGLSLFFFIGCAVQSRKDQVGLSEFLRAKKYDDALAYLENTSLKKEKENQLLYLMEKARIEFLAGHTETACRTFSEADELLDKLYTKKISKMLKSSFLNDNSKEYRGSIFERSLLYYSQAQCFFKLAQTGTTLRKTQKKDEATQAVVSKVEEVSLSNKERRSFAQKARASIKAWNSFFEKIRNSKIETLYRYDLMGKILAAQIHEYFGFKDRQIAYILYKDARKVLLTQAHTYKSYDKNFKQITPKFLDHLQGDQLKLKSDEFMTTTHFESLKDFLDFKVLSFTWALRRTQYKKMLKSYSPSKSVLERLKNNKGQTQNVSITLERGLIASMQAKKIDYSLESAIENTEDKTTKALLEGIGLPVLTYFVTGPLGLGFVSQTGNTYIYSRHNLGMQMTKTMGIKFEMPFVNEKPVAPVIKIRVKDSENKEVYLGEMVLIAPLSDIAMQAASERAANSYTKVGLRVATKHLVAIAASYATYKKMKDSNELLARLAAAGQYAVASKAIAESEKADIRHWSALPSDIHLFEINLKQGKYFIEFVGESNMVLASKEIEVLDKRKNLFSYHL